MVYLRNVCHGIVLTILAAYGRSMFYLKSLIVYQRDPILPSIVRVFEHEHERPQVLGVGSEYAHQKRLQNVIQHELRQTIREMEENRARGKALAAERRAIETHEEREMDSRKRPSSQS